MRNIFTLGKLIILLLVVLVGLVVFVYTYPVKPVVVKSIVINQSVYAEGDQLSYTVDRCKYVSSNVDGDVSRYLRSVTNPSKADILINHTKTGKTSRGCGLINQTILLQTNIPPDIYRLVVVSSYNQHL